jgi:hypothetical protein
MNDEIRCKRIIDGKTYNTETATLLGQGGSYDPPTEEALFKTRHGAYFLYYSDNEADERIFPLGPEKAQKWMEDHHLTTLIIAEFGEMQEAGDTEARITLRIPETLRKRVAEIARSRNQSLNAWMLRCLERAVEMEPLP